MASRYLTPFGGRGLMGRGDPFLELHREMNRLFDDSFQTMAGGHGSQGSLMAMPRLDVHEAGDNLEVSAELPGVRAEDVDLRLEGDLLTIRGEKRQEREDRHAHVTERAFGSFSRSIQLPFAPDPDKVRADFDHGVLTITLPRADQPERSRRIEIGNGPAGQPTIARGSAPSGSGAGQDKTGGDRGGSGNRPDRG